MFKTRTRMVSFRLSEDEYARLKDLSLMECARSVSEFARAALCKLPGANGDSATTTGPRMEKLEGAVRQLRTGDAPTPPNGRNNYRPSSGRYGDGHSPGE